MARTVVTPCGEHVDGEQVFHQEEGGHLSRRDQFLSSLMMAPPDNDQVFIEPYERPAVSPSNISIYSMKSASESLTSATDELASLNIQGKRLTPHLTPRGSPNISPSNSPSRHANIVHTNERYYISPTRQPGYHSPHRRASYPCYSVSPVRSEGSHISPHRASPASSIHSGGIIFSPSHSPVRFITGLGSRRGSDLSTYSFENDVPLYPYLSTDNIARPTPLHFSDSTSQFVANQGGHTPYGVAIPIHSSLAGNAGGIIYFGNPAASSRNSSQAREMGTQTHTEQQTTANSKQSRKPKFVKKNSRRQKKSNTTPKVNTKNTPIAVHEQESIISVKNNGTPSLAGSNIDGKTTFVMKTVTTVTPNNSSTSQVMTAGHRQKPDSTVHIDINPDRATHQETQYDKETEPLDVSVPLMTDINKEQSCNNDIQYTNMLTSEVPTERRPSITGPIPEIRMICATPEELTADSPPI